MPRLDGKAALISGGARGIGAADAAAFVREGAHVVVGDVLEELGQATADGLGNAAAFCRLDVTDESSWEAAVATCLDRFGRLDVLINNAGIIRIGEIATFSVEDYMKVLEVNQLGVFLGMRSVISTMIKSGGGSIVNMSSTAGLSGAVGHVAYCASKWAVRGMTKVAALELAPLSIRVNSVHPGPVDTQMRAVYSKSVADRERVSQSVPLGRYGAAEDIVFLTVYLASDESRFATGSEFVLDGGLGAGRTVHASRALSSSAVRSV